MCREKSIFSKVQPKAHLRKRLLLSRLGRLAGFCLVFLLLGGGLCEGGILLRGKEAKAEIGRKPASYFSGKSYSVLVLERKDRDRPHRDPIDAVIFNTGGGTFDKRRTRDRNQVVVLDSAKGRSGAPLDAETLSKVLSVIEKNHMVPAIFRRRSGEEQAVVFTDSSNVCDVYETPKGIRVHVKRASFDRSLVENPIRVRKLP